MNKLYIGQNMKPSKQDITDLSREEIAEKFSVSLKTAIRWQKHYDLFESKVNRINYAKADLIRKKYLNGCSPKDCQEEFGCSLTTVYRVLNNQIYPEGSQTADVSVSYNPYSAF